jgi:signal transduction histidine kinase
VVTRKLIQAEVAVAVVVALAAPMVWSAFGGDFWPRWVWFGVGLAIALQLALTWGWRSASGRRRLLAVHAGLVAVLSPADVIVWALSGGGFFWPLVTVPLYVATLLVHAWVQKRAPGRRERELRARVDRLISSRRGALDAQALELRRIERDLHDGAQARLVSLGMTLGLADRPGRDSDVTG